MSSNPYRGFRYPAEVIEHAVWRYHTVIEDALSAPGAARRRLAGQAVAVRLNA
jgi:hypothetical protein